MLLQDISQIGPLPRHPVRNHRDRDQEPNPVHGWNGKPEVIALEEHTLKPDRPSKRAWRRSMAISAKRTSSLELFSVSLTRQPRSRMGFLPRRPSWCATACAPPTALAAQLKLYRDRSIRRLAT